jgi:hypothetical protein
LKNGHLGVGIAFSPFWLFWGFTLAARTGPVKVRRYSALDGTIEVRFRSAEYAEKFVARIRAWEKMIQQGKAHD